MAGWRDPRHPVETAADAGYAAARTAGRKLDAALEAGIREGRRMTKLSAIGDRIAAKKAAHDKKAEEWASRLDDLDKREPAAFAFGDAAVAEREDDLSTLEADLRTLSNLPLAGSTK